MKKLLLLMFVLLLAANPPSLVQAQEPAVAGFHEHDGFFLRFHSGFGAGKMVEEGVGGNDLTISGLSGIFRFQIGGAISTNLILFGEMGGFFISDPQVEWGEISGTLNKVDFSINDYGAGLGFFFMPSNIYLSGSLTISRNKLEARSIDIAGTTEPGLGFYFTVGKEWWVSDNWGLGVAGIIYISGMKDKNAIADEEYNVKNSVVGIVFSATYQ